MPEFKPVYLTKTASAVIEAVRASLHSITARSEFKYRWIQSDFYEEPDPNNDFPTGRIIGARVVLDDDLWIFATCKMQRDNLSQIEVEIVLPPQSSSDQRTVWKCHCMVTKHEVRVIRQ